MAGSLFLLVIAVGLLIGGVILRVVCEALLWVVTTNGWLDVWHDILMFNRAVSGLVVKVYSGGVVGVVGATVYIGRGVKLSAELCGELSVGSGNKVDVGGSIGCSRHGWAVLRSTAYGEVVGIAVVIRCSICVGADVGCILYVI